MYRQDWMMRQIELFARGIAKLLFQKDSISYEIADETRLTDTDRLYQSIKRLLQETDICGAEDLLFEQFDPGNTEHIKVALDFYQTLNQMSDETLESRHFSREEIKDGVNEIMKLCGVSLPLL